MFTRKFALLLALFGASCLAYMTLYSRGNWGFVIPFRGTKLLALITVGVAVSSSTIVFQTVTRNRILTPSIMGFDALFVLLLAGAVYLFGAQNMVQFPAWVPFFTSLLVMVVAAILLFGTVLNQRQDLMRLVLTGIIFATLFRSLTSFLVRMIDPNEFAVVQVSSYARFTQIETGLLGVSIGLILVVHGAIWRMRHRLDVLGLGHEAAVNLGISPKRVQFMALVCVAVLVSVSTALVGPIVFLGLLVASVTYLVFPSMHHAVLLPSAGLLSATVLVAGQTAMERVFDLETPLTTVVDLLGGVLFLSLLLKGIRR